MVKTLKSDWFFRKGSDGYDGRNNMNFVEDVEDNEIDNEIQWLFVDT